MPDDEHGGPAGVAAQFAVLIPSDPVEHINAPPRPPGQKRA